MQPNCIQAIQGCFSEVCQQLMNEYPGVVVPYANFCGLLSKAWTKTITEHNIKSGFRACGIYPLDENQIPAEAYLPNMLHLVENENPVNQLRDKDTASVDASDNVNLDKEQLDEHSYSKANSKGETFSKRYSIFWC